MKNLFVAFSILATLVTIESASACSMPLPSVRQMQNLNQALESEEFGNAMQEQMRVDVFIHIVNIDLSKGVSAHLSNGCVINAYSQYTPPVSNGMCPRFKGVKVETICN